MFDKSSFQKDTSCYTEMLHLYSFELHLLLQRCYRQDNNMVDNKNPEHLY